VSNTLTVASHAVTNAGTFAVQAACTNAGTFAVQVDGSALTALQLIDDAVFADDAAFTLTTSKVMVTGAIRDDALSTLTAVEGDAVPLRVSSTGALHVTGGGGGTQYSIDDAAPTVVTMAGVVRDDSLTTLTEVDGDATVLRVSSTGALHVTGGGGGTEYTEDVATANPIVGTATMMERDDALSALTPIEGDWAAMRCDANGALWVSVSAALPAGTNAIGKLAANSGVDIGDVDILSIAAGDNNIGNVDIVTMPNVTLAAGTNTNEVVGDAAHDAAAAGNPLLMGAYASAAAPGDVSADADAVRIWALRSGAVATQPTYAGILAVAGNGAAGTGVQRVTIANDSTGILAGVTTVTTVSTLTSITNWGNVVDDAAFTPATTRVSMSGFFADEASTDSVDEGDAGAARMTLDRKVIVTPQPHTAGGLSIFRSIDLDETEEEVKASACCVYGGFIANLATTTRFVKFYNLTAANTTVGTSTPVITLPIPGNATDDIAAVLGMTGGMGIMFDTALSVAATSALADADTTAPGANDVVINLFYK
jgi:hypothetical protein